MHMSEEGLHTGKGAIGEKSRRSVIHGWGEKQDLMSAKVRICFAIELFTPNLWSQCGAWWCFRWHGENERPRGQIFPEDSSCSRKAPPQGPRHAFRGLGARSWLGQPPRLGWCKGAMTDFFHFFRAPERKLWPRTPQETSLSCVFRLCYWEWGGQWGRNTVIRPRSSSQDV